MKDPLPCTEDILEVGERRKYSTTNEGGRKKQRVLGESGEGGIYRAACEWFELEGEERRA